MKAIILAAPGDTENLIIKEIDLPTIEENEVLVQVKAISINPVDVKTRSGKGLYTRLKTEGPLIIGWDIAGVVTDSKSASFKVGDEVFGMVNFPGHGKAYADYVAAPAAHLALKPENINFEEAAAATLAALTAYQALVKHGNVQANQNVLIHAAAGGVGHYAVQIAKHLGAKVTGTSSVANKDFVIGIGADDHIDYKIYDWKTGDKKFDFVLDTIGGDNIDKSLEVIKKGGTIISIPSGLNEFVTEKAKEKGVNGFLFLVESSGKEMEIIAGYLKQGLIKSHIAKTFAFEEMAKAHQQVETGKTVGKTIVVL